MGIISKVFKTVAYGSTGVIGTWAIATRNSKFVPVSTSDPIFGSAAYKKNNPNAHPGLADLCVKKVPLSKIKPHLLEKEGKLAEAFCAGVWGGLGYAYQRHYLEGKYRGPTTAHQLWDTRELQESSYEVGTQITDHFEVVDKTPEHITVRCGDSPLKQDVRPSDGLFEMSAKINKEEGVVEFGLKSIFYNGVEPAGGMPVWMAFLHREYAKLWMETAVRNTTL